MDKVITNEQKIDEILERRTIVEILPSKRAFNKLLLNGKKLRFYIGFDATAPTLHLSHAKNLILLEKFRKLGHEAIVLFGDFTARIGDPSGENEKRKQLTRDEVSQNVKKWQELVQPLMDFDDKVNPPKIMFNHDWLAKLNLEQMTDLASNFTVQQMLARDMFKKRIKDNRPIFLHEFLYPLMQGYDSVAMEVDVEICGTDQIFNALSGRELLKKIKNKNKFVVAVTLMENPKTGELMSKSKGIGVFLDTAPEDMYGQIMSQPDEMMELLFVNNTLLSLVEIEGLLKTENPRDAKMRLAYEITEMFHGKNAAEKAEENFKLVVQEKKIPDDIPEVKMKLGTCNDLPQFLIDLKFVKSKGEAKRLVAGGGVKVDNAKIEDIEAPICVHDGMVIQVGKRRFLRIKKK